MANQHSEDTMKAIAFGRRKLVPRVCIADGKQHIRKFLAEALEEIGFVTCECAKASELSAILDEHVPDLVIMGLSAGGIVVAAILEALKERAFDGKALLVGPRNSLMLAALQGFGGELGIAMLDPLITPFDNANLRQRIAAFVPVRERENPAIDATEALAAGWLELWYQPKFNTHTLQLCGAEAQIRVRHPNWGIVQAAHFLPDKGDPCLRKLSDFVINQVIEDWHYFVTQHRAVDISINLPIDFFQDTESIENLCHRIPNHPAFGGLMIEVETADVIRNLDSMKAASRLLRFSNIGISLDNLGSEWPPLMDVCDFPFVEIKVDRQFIDGCGDDRLKRTACRQILDFADGLGVRTVAEGVQSRADFFAVREMDFDTVQGFLFAKPMTAQKFGSTALRQPVTIQL